MTTVVDLASELIRRRSVSPDDAGCQSLLADRLAAAGFTLEWMPNGDTLNLWARRGTARPCFTFAGHTDVVPSGDTTQWQTDPFTPTLQDGMLYGRGAADMKGSLAAMVIAAERFVQANPDHQGSLAFLLTSDEEASAVNGTVKVVETLMARDEMIDYCLVGEPSSTTQVGDVVKNGRRGSMTGNLYLKGVQGHVAYPHLADNPVHKSLTFLNDLVNIEWDQGNEFFPPTSLQIANVQAGTGSNNVIPGELYVQFNLRFSTEVTTAQVQQRVADLLALHDLPHTLAWNISGQPFLTAQGQLVDAVIAAIQRSAGITPQLLTTGGTSDGRFIAQMGSQIVELGPVNATIHKINECVRVADLEQLTDMYQHTLENLLL